MVITYKPNQKEGATFEGMNLLNAKSPYTRSKVMDLKLSVPVYLNEEMESLSEKQQFCFGFFDGEDGAKEYYLVYINPYSTSMSIENSQPSAL